MAPVSSLISAALAVSSQLPLFQRWPEPSTPTTGPSTMSSIPASETGIRALKYAAITIPTATAAVSTLPSSSLTASPVGRPTTSHSLELRDGGCEAGYVSCTRPGGIVCAGGAKFGICATNNCALVQDLAQGVDCGTFEGAEMVAAPHAAPAASATPSPASGCRANFQSSASNQTAAAATASTNRLPFSNSTSFSNSTTPSNSTASSNSATAFNSTMTSNSTSPSNSTFFNYNSTSTSLSNGTSSNSTSLSNTTASNSIPSATSSNYTSSLTYTMLSTPTVRVGKQMSLEDTTATSAPARSWSIVDPSFTSPPGSPTPTTPPSPLMPSTSSGTKNSTVEYTMYTGDGSTFPDIDKWISTFDELWELNQATMSSGCSSYGANSASETAALKSAIQAAAKGSKMDARYILAEVMQESKGCVRVVTTSYGHANPGLLQDYDGPNSCNIGGKISTPCPGSSITGMINDGVFGNQSPGQAKGVGLMQDYQQAGTMKPATKAAQYYIASRIYNSGAYVQSDLGCGVATHCYASDVANRLMGWSELESPCQESAASAKCSGTT